ncbi:MAG: ATP-binding protein [Leptospira sp.]|nr:ATP-binding protein [Leptospira sp.]
MRTFLLLFLGAVFSLSADSIINLRDRPVYVRTGFNLDWQMDSEHIENSDKWKPVPMGNGREFSLAARFMDLPTQYERRFLSLDDSPEETFSYVFHFSLDKISSHQEKIAGILLPTVGMRWQVYLNGEILHDKLTDGKNNTRYQYIVPVPHKKLIQGENTLLFRIQGSRSHHMVGFYKSGDYLLGDFDRLNSLSVDLVPIALVVIYLIIALLHFILYFKKLSVLYNALYAGFSITLAVYIMSSSKMYYYFFEDSVIAYQIQSMCFFLLPLLGILFFKKLFNQKISIIEFILAPLTTCLVVASMLFSVSWIFDAITVYKFILPFLALYVLIWIIGKEFWNEIKNEVVEADKKKLDLSFFQISIKSLTNTVSGNLFFGTIVFTILMLIDIMDTAILYQGYFFSQYGFLVFVFAIAIALSNRYINISEKNQELNTELEIRLKELESTDQKNKFLVDGTTDLLFVIGPHYEIRSMNQAARKYFGVKPESLIGKSFMDLLYTTPKDQIIVNQLVEENLRALSVAGKQIQFRARIRTSRMQEPLAFAFRMEAVDAGDHLEFIGKATSALDENLTNFIVKESQVYQIDNYILMAEELSHRLVRVLKKFLPEYRVDAVRTGLREVLVNSIEHGNLNISFEEKSQHLSKGDYLELISSRQKDPIYRSRKVTVEYILTETFATYTIQDEGNGFDYHELTRKAMANQALGREHGRGIMLAENIFDVVEYRGSGNSVFLKLNL